MAKAAWDHKTTLTDKERDILNEAANKVVASIYKREKNKTKRTLLFNLASNVGLEVWFAAARQGSKLK